MLLINSPKWFGTVYKLVSPLLREETKSKIFIYSKGKKQDEALKTLLHECGGDVRDLTSIEPHEMEKDLRNFVSNSSAIRLCQQRSLVHVFAH